MGRIAVLAVAAWSAALLAPWASRAQEGRDAAETEALLPGKGGASSLTRPLALEGMRQAGGDVSESEVMEQRSAARQDANEEALRQRLQRAIAERGRLDGLRFIDLPVLFLEAEAYVGKRVLTAGFPGAPVQEGKHPHFLLQDRRGDGAALAVWTGTVSRKERYIALDAPDATAVVVEGTLKKTGKGELFLEAGRLETLGPLTLEATLSYYLRHGARADPTDPARRRAAYAAALASLKADRKTPYVELEDLIIRPSQYYRQEVATLGVVGGMMSSRRHPLFQLAVDPYSQNKISVLAERLGTQEGSEVLRFYTPACIVAVMATVRRTKEGAYYLDAASVRKVVRAERLNEFDAR